jgi:membrane fusion protein, copper/silver efflux system
MNYSRASALAAIDNLHLWTLLVLFTALLILSALIGCDNPAPTEPDAKSAAPEAVRLVRQDDGSELMVIANPAAEEGLIGSVRQASLPDILEATGLVTFDDKLVSTISSRLTGRIEQVRTSQWKIVRRGEPLIELYSPDYMSAEAEYLAATSDDTNEESAITRSGSFGLPAGFSMAASLKEAAIRKLELLGFSPADIARIRKPSPSVWVPAPISGIVVSENVERGQQVNPGDQLFALATLQRVWITANIYEDDIARVQIGQSLDAVTASYPGEVFHGTVQRISPAVDPNIHTLQLRCQFSNPGSLLRPQMLAQVSLVTIPRQALVVPQAALVFDGDAYFAFIVTGADTIARRRVEIADWNEPGYARVLSGVQPGDRFLISESLKFNALWHEAHATAS